ncbi:MAG: hypothetical protein K2X81_18470 [Candidatus Obscuribacterales bacterium]|nr:hypothetical protein [Candidatus Obscuribacterales bacterium]
MDKKFPKWRVGLAFTQYFMVEVEAPTEEIAIEKAWSGACYESDKVETGSSSSVTSVFICDKDARNFAHYIPEVIPEPEDKKAGKKDK